MQKNCQLTNRLEKLLANSKSTLESIDEADSPSSAPFKIIKEHFRELIIALDGVLSLYEITDREEGGGISCEELMHVLSKESALTHLELTVESPLPQLFINEARFLSSLRWLFRGAIRNGHTHARVSSKNPELIISFSSTAITSTGLAQSHNTSILEYLIADEILSLYGHSLSWTETDGLSTCLIPMNEE
jgi:hypothetical protein